MKKNLLVILVTILDILSTKGQVLLSGNVVEQNSGNKPVVGVVVKSEFANQQKTSSDGSFTLQFNKIQAGATVTLIAEKDHWVVLNDKEMTLNVPGQTGEMRVRIVMCPYKRLEEAKREYYKICDRYVNEKYEKILLAIDKSKNGWEQKVHFIDSEKHSMEQTFKEIAVQYASSNIDDMTGTERNAFELFKYGYIDSCIALLNSIVSGQILRNLNDNRNQEGSLQKENGGESKAAEGEDDIENLEKLVSLNKLHCCFKNANESFRGAVSIDAANVDNIHTYGHLSLKPNKQDEEIRIYSIEIRQITGSANKLDRKADLLNDLGVIYNEKGEHSTSEKMYKEALEIYRKLANVDPRKYNLRVAIVLSNMVKLYKELNDFSTAEKICREAIEITRRLATENPKRYDAQVAYTLNDLGIICAELKNINESEKAFKEELEIYRKLATYNPVEYEYNVAKTLSNLGFLFCKKMDFIVAEKSYREALEILRRYADIDSAKYEADVAVTLNGIGIYYYKKGSFSNAEKAYKEALTIRRKLAAANPLENEHAVTMTLINLGMLYKDINKYVDAEEAYAEALKIRRKLSAENPIKYEPVLGNLLENIGILYQLKQEFPNAEKAHQEALTIRRKLAAISPIVYGPEVAMTLNNLGILYTNRRDFKTAERAYDEVIEIYRKLAAINREVFESELAKALDKMGLFYMARNDHAASEKMLKAALELYRELAAGNPTTYEPKVALSISNLGSALMVQDRYEEAEKYLTMAFEKQKEWVQLSPSIALESCETLLELGKLYKIKYTPQKANQWLTEWEKAKTIILDNSSNKYAQYLQPKLIDLAFYLRNVETYENIKALIKKADSIIIPKEKVRIQMQVIAKYEQLKSKGGNIYTEMGAANGTLAWYRMLTKEYTAAEKTARMALFPTIAEKPTDYDTTLAWIQVNLAHSLLFQGKYKAAEKIYQEWKDRLLGGQTTFREAFLEDFTTLEKAGISHPDVAKIKVLLELK